jgi:hypothetical protein
LYVACDSARTSLPLVRMRMAQAEQAFDTSEARAVGRA